MFLPFVNNIIEKRLKIPKGSQELQIERQVMQLPTENRLKDKRKTGNAMQ